MRASIGNAVMDSAAPRNSIASKRVACVENSPGSLTRNMARPAPRMNGATMPAAETASRASRPAPKRFNIEFHSHQEHVESHPQLRAHIQDLERLFGKQQLLHVRKKETQQRGPQEHPRNHLADHLRLPKPPRQRAHHAARRQNDRTSAGKKGLIIGCHSYV